jgi:hypothetical protein
MRDFLLILILAFVFQTITAQDIINTKDNQQLKVIIIEKDKRQIRYRMIDYEDGPIISMSNNRISRIEYKNGVVDLMGNQNPRKNKPFGISAGSVIWVSEEGGMLSSTIDYFIIPQVDLEINIGTDFAAGYYFSGGSRFHLNSNFSDNRFTPFTGLLAGSEFGDVFIQIPVGLNYLGKPGFNASLSLNQMFFLDSWQATLIELRVGWKFKL